MTAPHIPETPSDRLAALERAREEARENVFLAFEDSITNLTRREEALDRLRYACEAVALERAIQAAHVGHQKFVMELGRPMVGEERNGADNCTFFVIAAIRALVPEGKEP